MTSTPAPRTIITSHTNADMDAVASMVAARKLYPDALILLPQLLARDNNHPFYLNLAEIFQFAFAKDCDLTQVSLLVVVDVSSPDRLNHIAPVLENKGLRIHIYDHHPPRPGDLVAEKSVVETIGSATALLVHIIKEKGIALTRDEATLCALGIYEDTGSFRHGSTAAKDFTAAAHLLEFSPDFDIIKHFTSELTGYQVQLLDMLLRNATTHNIQGTVVTLTEVTLDEFHDDFASVVDKFMALEGLSIVIVLAVMEDKVQVIARSSNPVVDVGKLCERFGGGGHPQAASASVKNTPLAEIRAEALSLLTATITPQSIVGLYMTSPAKVLYNNQTIRDADSIMARYGLKAVPIIDAGSRQCVGILEQQLASRAVTHKLGNLSVTEYMQRNFHSLAPDSPLPLAVGIILRERQRLVPIIENNAVIGVLTRTDVIKLLIEEPIAVPDGVPLSQKQRERNIAALLQEHLPKDHLELLQCVGTLADTAGINAYLVGGFARDLLLQQPNLDLDIAVEGDAIAFAGTVAKELKGHIKTHEHFKTATVFYTDKFGTEQHLDIATTRLEFYEHPAALPTVERSSIKMDLFRRDFSINALAIQINTQAFGTLIDPFGAQRDLKEKRIVVLHSLSLVEDPTRIFRAARFAQRFNFQIGAQTERLIKNALQLGMIEKLSGARIFNELKHIFQEKEAPSCLRRLNSWQLLATIHPGLKLTALKDSLLSDIEEAIAWYNTDPQQPELEHWQIYILGFCANARYPEASSLLERLGFTDTTRKSFLAKRIRILEIAEKAVKLGDQKDVPNSTWYETFFGTSTEGLLYILARYGDEHGIGKYVSLYLTQMRHAELFISGDDLIALGGKPSPLFGETLRYVFNAHLDGQAPSRKEQLDMAKEYLIKKSRLQKTSNKSKTGCAEQKNSKPGKI